MGGKKKALIITTRAWSRTQRFIFLDLPSPIGTVLWQEDVQAARRAFMAVKLIYNGERILARGSRAAPVWKREPARDAKLPSLQRYRGLRGPG